MYQGYVPGARHYYGWIKTPDRKEFSLSRSMSSKEIRIANRETKAEGITGDVYRPGSKTHCYDGMDQIEADAIEEFLRRAPEGDGSFAREPGCRRSSSCPGRFGRDLSERERYQAPLGRDRRMGRTQGGR
jgi:hypothetical protein